MKRRIILASLVVAALAAAGAAYAVVSQTAATETITACVNGDGQLRLAPSAGTCKKNEQLLTWNTVGPVGPVGPAGANGRDGRDATSPDAVAATITATGQASGKIADGIAVTAVSHEIVSPRDAATGAATGRRMHKPFTITMSWGASTPLFIHALVSNEHLTAVEVDLSRGGVAIGAVKLTNAVVADYQLHGDAVTFSFTYQKIEWDAGSSVAMDDWELTP